MTVSFARHEIPGPPTWPHRTHGRYALTPVEDAALTHAARDPDGRLWSWLDDYDVHVIPPDRLPLAIDELARVLAAQGVGSAATPDAPRGALAFLRAAHQAGHHVEVTGALL